MFQTVAINRSIAINNLDVLNQWYYDPPTYAIMANCANTVMGVVGEQLGPLGRRRGVRTAGRVEAYRLHQLAQLRDQLDAVGGRRAHRHHVEHGDSGFPECGHPFLDELAAADQ